MKKETTKKTNKSLYYPDGLPENASRLAIFVFYDKDGIVDDYISYLLNDLKENLTDLVIVANGKLTAEGRRRFTSLTPNVYVRENMGFDVGAWKYTILNYLGWDKIAQYDELVLLNDTFYGPFYPFREVFQEMNHCPVDFWGLNAHGATSRHVGPSLYPYTPEYIQSFFMVIRKNMHTSYEFQQYWIKQPFFQTENEVTGYHECAFTKYFSDMGFTWSVLSDTRDMDGDYRDNVSVPHCWFSTYELIKNRRCPVIKRCCFGLDYAVQLNFNNGSQLRKSIDYIVNDTNYDVSMIYKNLLRVYNSTDIFTNLHLQYILPKGSIVKKQERNSRAVMVFFLYYMERLDDLRPYISNIPSDVDVILTTKPQESIDIVYQKFFPALGGRLRVVLAGDSGRDLSALLVAVASYLKEYDIIGFCHDKGPHKMESITFSRDFQEIIVENTIGSSAYIENVLNVLEDYPEIGLLVPPPPSFGHFIGGVQSRFWGAGCFEQTRTLSKRLGLNVDISEDKWPLALGTAFWCRRDALAPLLDYPWTYDDFPPEPLPIDGTLLHALERIFPFVAQHQGYLSGWVMTDEYAALEINNMHYLVDQLLHSNSNNPVMQIGLKGALVNYIKKHLPKPLWGFARKIKRLLRW